MTALLRPSDFYRDSHKDIFKCIAARYSEGLAVDLTLVKDALSGCDKVKPAYLLEVFENAETPVNVTEYARTVRDAAARRQVAASCEMLKQIAVQPGGPVDDIIAKTDEIVQTYLTRRDSGKRVDLDQLVAEFFLTLDAIRNPSATSKSLTTGFRDLDNLLFGGLEAGGYYVIAARPSMGKSTLAYNLAHHWLMASRRVLLLSYETRPARVLAGILFGAARVNAQIVYRGKAAQEEIQRLALAGSLIAESKALHIPNTGGKEDVMDATNTIRDYCQREKIDVVIVDYLQMLSSIGGRRDGRQQEVTAISRRLKLCAERNSVPIVVLSQLSRKPDEREDHRPMLSDLRESGAIEQDADVVMMLYRDDYYDRDTQDKGICEVNVAKNRNGPTDTVKLTYLRDICRFEDYVSQVPV